MSELSPKLTTIYYHGLPGSAHEIEMYIHENTSPPIVLAPLDFDGFDALIKNAPTDGVHIIGFSMGAMTALKLAAQRPESVKKLTLIAPASPLSLGRFLPDMVGRPVFKAAKLGFIPFKIFTAIQRLGVVMAPNKIIETMFLGSPQPDLDLISNPSFKQALLQGLKLSLGIDNQAYRKAIHEFIGPWDDCLTHVKCPVTLHHGTADNWAPIAMSHALEKTITSKAELIEYDGLGHYSVLHKVMPLVLSSS